MQFKINNTVIKISFSFFAIMLLFLTMNNFRMYLLSLAFGLIHELIHLLFICMLSAPPKTVSLTLFGGNIVRQDNTAFTPKSEFIINISAPIFNILTGLIFSVFLFLNSSENTLLKEIIFINLFLGGFNILPYYNFDGGNALKSLLLIRLSHKKAEGILTVSSIIITVLISCISVYIFFVYKKNVLLIGISLYLILMILFKK